MSSQIDAIQVDIDDCKKAIAEMEALDRLMVNRDFKEIILEGLFKDEAARLVGLKAAAGTQSEQHQTFIMKSIDMIGSLQQYFNGIRQIGLTSQQSLRESEDALVEMAEQGEV